MLDNQVLMLKININLVFNLYLEYKNKLKITINKLIFKILYELLWYNKFYIYI
jgi:hypothetical protein